MTDLPAAPLERVLRRMGAIWHPTASAHVLIYAATGSGKTTLGQQVLRLCSRERVLICDPKPAPDPVWDCPSDPGRYGTTVTELRPRFGFDGTGGGPHGLWVRLIGDPDRRETGRRFGAALDLVMAEGHCVVWLDDVRETCRQLGLQQQVDSLMSLGRSANVLGILSTVDPSYVEGRSQAGIVWVGATNGLAAAKAGAALLGQSGRAWSGHTAALRPHQWIYADGQQGAEEPCCTSTEIPAEPRSL